MTKLITKLVCFCLEEQNLVIQNPGVNPPLPIERRIENNDVDTNVRHTITFSNWVVCNVNQRTMDKHLPTLKQTCENVHIAMSDDIKRYSGSLPSWKNKRKTKGLLKCRVEMVFSPGTGPKTGLFGSKARGRRPTPRPKCLAVHIWWYKNLGLLFWA